MLKKSSSRSVSMMVWTALLATNSLLPVMLPLESMRMTTSLGEWEACRYQDLSLASYTSTSPSPTPQSTPTDVQKTQNNERHKTRKKTMDRTYRDSFGRIRWSWQSTARLRWGPSCGSPQTLGSDSP